MTRPRIDDDREQAICQTLIDTGFNVRQTAKQTGESYATVHRRKAELGNVSETIRERNTAIWDKAQKLCAERIIALVPVMPETPDGLNAVTKAAQTSVNAHLDYRDGRKGSLLIDQSVTNNNLVIEYADDWRG